MLSISLFIVRIDKYTLILTYMSYFNILISGFGGGMIRGLIGFLKHQYSYKNVKFEIPYFLTMIFLSGIIGTLVAITVKETGMVFLGGYFTPALAFIIGYAGGDFIENIYKIILKKPSLYSLPGEEDEK